ncbi:MAG: hypothetical protein ABMA14_06050 [Hyphomonadaceae bacterium]
MKRSFAFALVALAAACTPAPTPEPAATVEGIYKTIAASKGARSTDIATVPMTEDLALKLQEVESKADGPVIDGDIAGNCQDCTGFSDLKVGAPPKDLPITAGHTMVEARFKILQGEQRAILWDMVKVGEAWKVDNIETEGFNLRTILDEQLSAQAEAANAVGEAAVNCMTFIRLESDALAKAKPPGDVAALEHAYTAWKTRAEGQYSADELAQYFASNVAVFDDTPAAEIKLKADDCVAQVPAPVATP